MENEKRKKIHWQHKKTIEKKKKELELLKSHLKGGFDEPNDPRID